MHGLLLFIPKLNYKRSTLSKLRGGCNNSIMEFYKVFYQIKAQTRAFNRMGRIILHPIEFIKNMIEVVWSYTDTIILYFYIHPFGVVPGLHPDGFVFSCIFE